MKRFDKIRLAIICILIVAILLTFLTNMIKKQLRINELIDKGFYHLYTSYIARYEEYRVFVMINNKTNDETELTAWAKEIITDQYIKELRADNIYETYGECPIVVYLVSASEELPFGWEKDELNIEMNFDSAVFYRNSHIMVKIPIYADNFNRCLINFQYTN